MSGTATRPQAGGDPSVRESRAPSSAPRATRDAWSLSAAPRPPWRTVVLAFAIVYAIWGSTYLGIYYAIRTMPVFLMGAIRFVIAGMVLSGIAVMRGAARPQPREMWTTVVAGVLLLSCGTGSVIWAEQQVPTGLTALMLTTPLWIALIEWIRGRRPTWGVIAGLVLGVTGLAILIDPRQAAGAGVVSPVAVVVLIFGSLCWAAGTLYARYSPLPSSPWLATGLQMVWGGVALIAAAAVAGEFHQLDLRRVSAVSWLALAYLIVFGSLIAFTAYIWLVRHVPPAMTATYAFVCPVVAVILGWAVAGESLSARTAVAGASIVAAVALTTLAPGSPSRPETPAATGDASPTRRH